MTSDKSDNSKTRFNCCDGCEPRHIPQGDVLLIQTKPIVRD